jgi:hypothetical protein
MSVLDQRRPGADVDARLDDLAPGDTEILPLQIGAPQSRRLLYRPTTRAPAAALGRDHHTLPGVVSQVTVRRSPLRGITLVVWFRRCCAVRRLGKAVHAANDAAAIDQADVEAGRSGPECTGRTLDREPMASPGAACLALAWRHRIALLAR